MDTAIPKDTKSRKRQRRYLTGLIILVLLAAAILLVRSVFRPELSRSAFTVAVVGTGDVENTVSASGVLVPEFEEAISCPINASIEKVLVETGSKVSEGQPILLLDKSATRVEHDKLQYQLESKRNNITKLGLELDKSFYDLKSNNEIKQLRINSLTASVENAKRLYQKGGGTREDIELAELNMKVAQLEKSQLENEIAIKQKTMRAELRQSEIELEIQERDLKEMERKLALADIRSGRAGVVTWVNRNIGSTVREGEPLVHIADLGSYKVSGSIPDGYLDQLQAGRTVIIRINDSSLTGLVSNIYPSVQNGFASFDVQLNDRSNKLYRPNLKVDVYLVTASHSGVLRVANGAAFTGAAGQDVFVVKNGKAFRRRVETGLSNFDYVEIKAGLHRGEAVINSDMSNYRHLSQIKIAD